MVKIRSDLKGVVVVGGTMFRAGDPVPARVKIGDHLVEKVKDGAASKGASRAQKKAAVPDETD